MYDPEKDLTILGTESDMLAEIWYCDQDCNCRQLQITQRAQNKHYSQFRNLIMMWEGEFLTDGEPFAANDILAWRAVAEVLNARMPTETWESVSYFLLGQQTFALPGDMTFGNGWRV